MGVQTSIELDLSQDHIISFLSDSTLNTYEQPLDLQPYINDGFIELGSPLSVLDPNNTTISALWGKRKYFRVIQINSYSGLESIIDTFDFIVPTTQALTMECRSVLLAKSTLPIETQSALIAARGSFPVGSDPTSYFIEVINDLKIDASSVEVIMQISLSKSAAPVEHLDELNYISNMYPGAIIGNQNSGQYFEERRIRIEFIKEENIAYGQPQAPSWAKDVPDPEQPGNAISEIAAAQPPLFGCEIDTYNPLAERIMTLFNFPEFRVEWKPFYIKIGCIRIKLWYPKLYTRTGKIVLYAHASLPQNADSTLIAVVKRCVIVAALGGAVTGVVMANPGAALAAFQAIFWSELEKAIPELVACILIGLALLKESNSWSAV